MNNLHKVSKKEFWEERYLNKTMPWDIAQAAPAFVKYFAEHGVKSFKNIVVLGCGRGHDASYLAKLSDELEVFGFDFSEGAINYCKKIKEKENIKNVQFIQADFFELIKDKKWKNYFDFVIEHTSLAAIDPKRRKEYIGLIDYLLKPDGRLVGMFLIKDLKLGGPPFGISEKELRTLFNKKFIEIKKLRKESCSHSFKGKECFGVFEKK